MEQKKEKGLRIRSCLTGAISVSYTHLDVYKRQYLEHAYGKKVIILLDEYDTPMQEAYVYGYWEEMTSFLRNLFNATFKTNKYCIDGLPNRHLTKECDCLLYTSCFHF